MARSGLKKVVKTVKGKKGTVKRSYWVKASLPQKKATGIAGKARKALTALRTMGGNHYVQSALIGAGTGALGKAAALHGAGVDVARVGMERAQQSQSAGGARARALAAGSFAHFGSSLGTQMLAAHRNKSSLKTLGAYIGGAIVGEVATHHLVGNRVFRSSMDREARRRYGTQSPAQP